MRTNHIHAVGTAESLSDLVRRIAERDRAAFGRFYHRLVRRVYTQIHAGLGSPAAAEPVTRAVFVEVWRLAPVSHARHDDVLAWVSAIAARRTADRLRALRHQPLAVDNSYDGHVSHELAAVLPGGGPWSGCATGENPTAVWPVRPAAPRKASAPSSRRRRH